MHHPSLRQPAFQEVVFHAHSCPALLPLILERMEVDAIVELGLPSFEPLIGTHALVRSVELVAFGSAVAVLVDTPMPFDPILPAGPRHVLVGEARVERDRFPGCESDAGRLFGNGWPRDEGVVSIENEVA